MSDERKAYIAQLIEQASTGAPIKLSGSLPTTRDERHTFTPEEFRSLVLQALSRNTDGRSATRVHIVGGYVTGDLDLRDVRGPDSTPCGALVLENCFINGAVDFRAASLSRIDLSGSRFSRFDGRDLHTSGPVVFTDVGSCDDQANPLGCIRNDAKQPLCCITLTGAKIGGSLTVNNTSLAVEEFDARRENSWPPGEKPSALRLTDATVNGDVLLQPDFVAHGGIAAARATINGTIWLAGSIVSAEWMEAIDLSETELRGSFVANNKTKIDGQIRFYNSAVEGGFHLSGELKSHYLASDKPDWEKQISFLVYQSKLPSITIGDVALSGNIHIRESEVGATKIQTVELRSNQFLLSATATRFTGPVEVWGLKSASATKSDTAPVGETNAIEVTPQVDLVFDASTFEGNVSVHPEINATTSQLSFSAAGAQFAYDFKFEPINARSTWDAINFSNARVDGDLVFRKLHTRLLSLVGARLRSLTLGQSFGLVEVTTTADFSAMAVAGNIAIDGLRAQCPVVFDRTTVGGDLALNDCAISIRGRQSALTALSLVGTAVGGFANLSGLQVSGEKNRMPTVSLETAAFARGLRLGSGPVATHLDALTSLEAARQHALSFLPTHRVIEARPPANGATEIGVLSYLWDGSNVPLALGTSAAPIFEVIRARNSAFKLTEVTVRDYLEFFCAYVWGPDGAFRLVRTATEFSELVNMAAEKTMAAPKSGLLDIEIRRVPPSERTKDKQSDEEWEGRAYVAYSNALFEATFRIFPDGEVRMINDTPIAADISKPPFYYKDAKRFAHEPSKDPWPLKGAISGIGWKDLSTRDLTALLETISPTLTPDGQAILDLRSARTQTVRDDMFGVRPPIDRRLRFRLDGFTFEHASTSSENQGEVRAPAALRWLRQQFSADGQPRQEDYIASSYTRFVDLFRATGRNDDADQVQIEKLRVEARLAQSQWTAMHYGLAVVAALALTIGLAVTAPTLVAIITGLSLFLALLPRVRNWFIWLGFGNFLKLGRAIGTMSLFIVIGWIGTHVANRGAIRTPPLAISQNYHLVLLDANFERAPQVLVVDTLPVDTGEVASSVKRKDEPCGTEIQPFFYALDVFLPLVDLRQESRCMPTTEPWARGWVWAKSIYALLGWLVTSLFVITATERLRQRTVGH